MNVSVPHIVQYQGSKRILAPQILRFMPKRFSRMIEPFAGTAAMTIAAAMENRADQYVVNDINAPLVGMLEEAIECPQRLLGNYARIWNEGGKEYGQDLPDDLGCKKYMLRAGLSTQATFLGRKKVTFEALYVSSGLLSNVEIQCVGQQILHEHLTKVESPKGIFDV